jgi:LysM repeat protein
VRRAGSACSGGALGLLLLLLSVAPEASEASDLTPTRAGLMRQVRAAQAHGYPHLANEQQVRRAVQEGRLVHLPGNRDYRVHQTVSFPYALPEVKLFVERLSNQYRRACGEQLVVTSLVRARNRQPPNASTLSVHPTGMALDLRVSASARCRSWLERTLVSLRAQGALEAARERNPPHYHVVVFPRQYSRYVADRTGGRAADTSYQVRPGDTLWGIARSHGTTVAELQRVNGVSGSSLLPGQVLRLPATGVEPTEARGAQRYWVRRGDSLWAIARRHGTTVERLREANGLSGSTLRPGQVLQIPGP